MEELQNPIVPQISNVGVKAFLNPPHSSYLLTGGDDRRIRYWDLLSALNSYTVCGNPSEQTKPRYASHVSDNITVHQEISTIPSLLEDPSAHHLLNPAKAGPASPSVNHHESILDLKLLELPHRMLISAGRDGVVKVWK
jgi:phosphoinositide-3-kinase regulatory subunit 4